MDSQILSLMKILPIFMISFFSFLSCNAQDNILKEGDKAPDFSLLSDEGIMVNLSSFEGKSNVVLYFYPKDKTPG